MTTQPPTWDPATDGAGLLEQVFECQRAAERLLDESSAADGSGAYGVPGPLAADAAGWAYSQAAGALRSGAELLERLATAKASAL
jgi:hypothetical protein